MPSPSPTTSPALRRAWRRLLRAVRPRRVEIVYAPECGIVVGNTPIDPDRGRRVLTFLLAEGLVPRRWVHRPRQASLKELRWVHSDRYLESLRRSVSLVPILGYDPGDALADELLEAQRFAVGGTVFAARRALDRDTIAVHLGGGLHHAAPDSGRAFCVFNDVAVAVADARRRGFDGRVLIVDLDLHDGNGTRRAFAADSKVFTYSVHNQTWDDRPAVASRSIELGGEVDDATYLGAIRDSLPAIADKFDPDWIVYVAGTDPANDDRLGNWEISAGALLERDRLVAGLAREGERRLPLTVVLAGGYGGDAWRYSARFVAWLLVGDGAPEPPDSDAATLERMRGLLFGGAGPGGGDDADELDWGLDEEDLIAGLGNAVRPTRLLDQFSRHGIELVLERSGLLDRLRRRGFGHPTVDLDLRHPDGQTLRVFGEAAREDLLVELRVTRDRRALAGFDLLRLEWLLLQDPRASFGPGHRPLPGQSHPGLGLLNEMMALLVLLAEQLKLDGILFVPSHYHLAALAAPRKQLLSFLEADDEAYFEAVEEALGELPLDRATAAMAAGRVRRRTDGTRVDWRPMPMVLALGHRLRQRVHGAERRAEVERVRRELDFELAPD